MWTIEKALPLIRDIEAIAPKFGAHVALTGGVLYGVGKRKDLDLHFYRVRQVKEIDAIGLFAELEKLGVTVTRGLGWVYKAVYRSPCGIKSRGGDIDIFFPEQYKHNAPVIGTPQRDKTYYQ